MAGQIRLSPRLGYNYQPWPRRPWFPNIPTTTHPMPIKLNKKQNLAKLRLLLPKIPIILAPLLLLLPAPMRECLSFVHLGNLLRPSRIVRTLIIPDPNKPREPERNAALINLMTQHISNTPQNIH